MFIQSALECGRRTFPIRSVERLHRPDGQLHAGEAPSRSLLLIAPAIEGTTCPATVEDFVSEELVHALPVVIDV